MTDFSYQLYSSRNFPPLADTLAMLAGLGYAQVEGYGGVYEDPEATAALLRETGLTMPSGHVGLDMLEGDPAGTVAMARTLGMETVFCPHLAEAARPVDAAGWQAFCADTGAIRVDDIAEFTDTIELFEAGRRPRTGARGIATVRFEFGYMAARRTGRRRPPPRAETLVDELVA